MPEEARKGKSQGGTSKLASKETLQASVPSVHCLQTNETDEKFSCVFIQTLRRTKANWR